jgi:hypothetical protein
MALYYGLADVALLGGSFEPLGGQNLIEPAACGCPVVMGPSTFNFAEAAELSLAAGASLRVEGMEQAVTAALKLVENPERRAAMVQAALAFSSSNRGAAERTAAAVLAIAQAAEPAPAEPCRWRRTRARGTDSGLVEAVAPPPRPYPGRGGRKTPTLVQRTGGFTITGGTGAVGIVGGVGLNGCTGTGGTTGMLGGVTASKTAQANDPASSARGHAGVPRCCASVALIGCMSVVQRAVGLAQLEVAQQHVVARLRQVALGLEQLALRVEHVDVDAHTHLVAELVGVERTLAGGLGRFQRLDLARTRHRPR